MEPIAPYPQIPVKAVWQRVQVRDRCHRLVKRCIKHRHLRCIGQQLHADLDPCQVVRVVQRRKDRALLDTQQHFFIDQHRRGKRLAAVYHPVPHPRDLTLVLDHADLWIEQQRQHRVDRRRMVGHRARLALFRAPRRIIAHHRLVAADPLHDPFPDHPLAIRLHQLILDGRAPAVQYQDFHVALYLTPL